MKISVCSHAVPKGSRKYTDEQPEDAFFHTDVSARPFAAAIADGHGSKGKEVNIQTSELAMSVAQMLCGQFDVSPQALCQLIQETLNDRFLESKNGAVATRVLFDGNSLHVLYVGDVRLYQYEHDGTSAFKQLTRDHNASHLGECKRLAPILFHPTENPQAKFLFFPPMAKIPRLVCRNSMLAVTRSFGDQEMHPAVISDPDVLLVPLDTSQRHVFALCSDGGNEIVEEAFVEARRESMCSLDELIALVRKHTPPDPNDDATILLIELTPDTP